jgi:hypothetical protein
LNNKFQKFFQGALYISDKPAMLALLLEIINQYLQHLIQATMKLRNQEAVPWNEKKYLSNNTDTQQANKIIFSKMQIGLKIISDFAKKSITHNCEK